MKKTKMSSGRFTLPLIRFIAVVSVLSVLLCCMPMASGTSRTVSENGTVTLCEYDPDSACIRVSGSINHRVLVSDKDAQVALVKINPYGDTDSSGEIVASEPISVKFDLSVTCQTAGDRMYAYMPVILSADGSRKNIGNAVIPSSSSSSLQDTEFKGIAGVSAEKEINSGAGSVILDVDPDRLISNSNSGYFFSCFGSFYYYDRGYTDELDKQIKSFKAAGTDIFLRIVYAEAEGSGDNFAGTSGGVPTVDSSESAESLYSMTAFLLSRYYGTYGNIRGIIAGKAADMFCGSDAGLIKEYGSALAVIGCACADYAGGSPAICMPLSDGVNPDGSCGFETFADSLCSRLEEISSVTLTFMFEMTGNPYGLDAACFEEISEETDGEDGITEAPETTSATETEAETQGENSSEPESGTDTPAETSAVPEGTETVSGTETGKAPEESSSPDGTTDNGENTYGPDESSEVPTEEDTTLPEESTVAPGPEKNDPADLGFYSTDSISPAIAALKKAAKSHSSVASKWICVWYPEEDTGDALSCCYAYSYMSMLCEGASVFFVNFENCGEEAFGGLEYLFRYINTENRDTVISGLAQYFGEDSWEELIPGCSSVKQKNYVSAETVLEETSEVFTGSYGLWDFTSGSGLGGWYAGLGCSSLKSVYADGIQCLRASFDNTEYSDIGVIADSTFAGDLCDSLSFDIGCNGVENGIYEIKIFVYGEDICLQASAAVTAGKRTTLYMDLSSMPDGTKVTAVRISSRPVTGGDGSDYGLMLYSINLNSKNLSSLQLAAKISAGRQENQSNQADTVSKTRAWVTVIVAVAAMSVTLLAAVWAAEKRKNTKDNKGE